MRVSWWSESAGMSTRSMPARSRPRTRSTSTGWHSARMRMKRSQSRWPQSTSAPTSCTACCSRGRPGVLLDRQDWEQPEPWLSNEGGFADFLEGDVSPNGTASTQVRDRLVDGASFVTAEPIDVPTIWGTKETVLWVKGEGLLIVGPDGVGKTTLQQQLILGRLGLETHLLGLPVTESLGRVGYVVADRPRQAARSFRRMLRDGDLDELRERLVVWKGPLPFDLTENPRNLAAFANQLEIDTLFIDSLKDVALDLSKDETGSRVNLAFQELIAGGVDLSVLHHQRKGQGEKKPKQLADVYGSRWITAGMGSVLMLWGEAGDLVIEVSHLKQPLEEFGPINVVHDHVHGTTRIDEGLDLERAIANATHGMIVEEAARLLFHNDNPNRNQIEK